MVLILSAYSFRNLTFSVGFQCNMILDVWWFRLRWQKVSWSVTRNAALCAIICFKLHFVGCPLLVYFGQIENGLGFLPRATSYRSWNKLKSSCLVYWEEVVVTECHINHTWLPSNWESISHVCWPQFTGANCFVYCALWMTWFVNMQIF